MLGPNTDVTTLKQSEAHLRLQVVELSERLAELRVANDELNDFADIASHDLQEPLRSLVSYSALLRQDLGENLTGDAADDLRHITAAAARMSALVQDLLALARSNHEKLRREPIRLDDCVDASLDALRTQLRESGAEVSRDALPQVTGDRTLLTQVYQNLLSNAVKFSDQGAPVIALTAGQNGRDWVLGVKDNGIGIQEKYADQIFAPFRRLHTRTEYDGSGIGLAICRRLVERLGGKMWVESEPGKGSHFRFTLPMDCEAS